MNDNIKNILSYCNHNTLTSILAQTNKYNEAIFDVLFNIIQSIQTVRLNVTRHLNKNKENAFQFLLHLKSLYSISCILFIIKIVIGLTDESCKILYEAIYFAKLNNIRELYIERNFIGDIGLSYLSKIFKNKIIPNLRVINMSCIFNLILYQIIHFHIMDLNHFVNVQKKEHFQLWNILICIV